MERLSLQTGRPAKEWTLGASAFHRLLEWLDEGAGSSGQSYLELRRRLVAYFDRKDCPAPDDLADETLNRVARRLDELGTIDIEAPAKYCYIIARHVFLENLRERQNYRLLDDAAPQTVTSPPDPDDEKVVREKMLDCLEGCTKTIDAAKRDLILRYYIGKQQVKIKNRQALARELGISVNALSIRACRIREKLGACVKQCVSTG